MKKIIPFFIVFILISTFASPASAQKLKAENIADAEKINKLLGESFQKAGFCMSIECRYLDPKNATRYYLVGIMEGGVDLLKMDFESSKKNIDNHKKANGVYDKIGLYEKGGPGAFYMLIEKDANNQPSYLVKFIKGKYLITFGTSGIPISLVQQKLEEISKVLTAKL